MTTSVRLRERAPERIGPYRLLAKIAEGGMGVVYRAEDERSGELVALKTVRGADASNLGSLRREIHALSRVRHPGVVRIAGQGVELGLPWYAMELIEGQTLRSLRASLLADAVETRNLAPSSRGLFGAEPAVTIPLEDSETFDLGDSRVAAKPTGARHRGGIDALTAALTVVKKLCWALAYVHGEGIVHRDLKPDNVIVRDGLEPVLVDFGLMSRFGAARAREAIEVAGSVIGTVEYMAPEQIRGELVDARADLYAIGCMLYEIVTGAPPFRGDAMSVAQRHLGSAPVPPSERANVPRDLEELILSLLEKSPRRRLGYAVDVAAALDRAGILGDPLPLAPPARPYLYRPTFAGRSDALATLIHALDGASMQKGQIVLIGGESGAGKTRIAMELSRSASRRQFRVVAGECVRLQGRADGDDVLGAALSAFRPILQAIADHLSAAGPDAAERVLGRRTAVLLPYEPALALVPGQSAIAEAPRLPAQAARERLVTSMVETLVAFAAEHPLLLVIDDLQWADDLTFDVLGALALAMNPPRPSSVPAAEAPPTSRLRAERTALLVVATYRSEEASASIGALRARHGVLAIDLPRLDLTAVGMIVSDMLALPNPPVALVESLARKAEGNPFFLAEYLRAAVGEGMLTRGEDGHWTAPAQGHDAASLYQTLPLPNEIRDLVGRRLAALSPRAKALCESASVLGRELDVAVLARAADVTDVDELNALGELVARSVLEDAGGGRLRFTHDKLREVAYDGLARDRRRALHGASGRAIEAVRGPTELAQELAALAHHFGMAELDEKTFEYLEKAGERALATSAHGDAAAFFGRALALAERKGGVDSRRRARWERLAGEAAFGTGDLRASGDLNASALGRLGAPLPATRARWAGFALRELVRQGASYVAGRALGRDDRDPGATVEAANAASMLALTYYFGGDALALVGTSLLAVNLAARARTGVPVARPYAFIGYVAGLSRLKPVARAFFDRAREVGEATHDPSALAFSLESESAWHLGFARWNQAESCATEALFLLKEIGDQQEAAVVETILGHVDHFRGRFEAARARYAKLLDHARTRGNVQHEAWGLYAMARSLLPMGAHERALGYLLEAKRLIQGHPDQASRVICDGLLAATYLARGDLASARAMADEVGRSTRGQLPTVFSTVTAYEACADVYLAIAERDRNVLPFAARACRELRLFARLFPLGEAASRRASARELWLEGKERRAIRALEASLAAARAHEMPFDEARALEELGRATKDAALERQAAALFERIGAKRA